MELTRTIHLGYLWQAYDHPGTAKIHHDSVRVLKGWAVALTTFEDPFFVSISLVGGEGTPKGAGRKS